MKSQWDFPAGNKLLPSISNPQSSKCFARVTDPFPSVEKLRHKSISLGQPWGKPVATATPCTVLPVTKVTVLSLHLAMCHRAETCRF